MQSVESFSLPVELGMANAVRRALLCDVRTEAPFQVTFHENTSCETDEYIAHRLGLVLPMLLVSAMLAGCSWWGSRATCARASRCAKVGPAAPRR